MKRFLLVIAACFLVVGNVSCRKHIDFIDSEKPLHNPDASSQAYAHSEGAIRFVQYNVGVFSKFMEDSSPLVASILKELEADAVGMNELDSVNRRHSVYQMKVFVEEKMGPEWSWNYFRAIDYRYGSYGNGVMARAEATGRWGQPLPVAEGSEPRSMCALETEKYVAVSAHIDNTTSTAAITAIAGLNDYVNGMYGDSDKLVVLMADTNTRKDTDAMKEMQKSWTIAATDGRFDYVLILNNRAKYRIVSSAVVTRSSAGDVSSASDHYPVFADIVIL